MLQNSLRLRRKIGDEEGEVGALRNLAKIYIDLGDTSRARDFDDERPLEDEQRAVVAMLKATGPHKNAAHPTVDGLEPGELPAASSGPATP